MKTEYDVIIVGARIAGASLAYELGRAGYKVLLVDKANFPSDVLSTHNFFNNSVAMLREMGVLGKLLATGTPTYKRAYVRLEEAVIDGDFPEANGETECLCIRRTHLDRILQEHAAAVPGVAVLEGFRVAGLLRSGETVTGIEGVNAGGEAVSFRSRLVVGADGRRSAVRRMAGSRRLAAVPTDFASYVGYFRHFRQEGEPCAEFYRMGEYLAIVFPTSDQLHVVGLMFSLSWSRMLESMKQDPEGTFRHAVRTGFGRVSFADRLSRSELAGPIRGLNGYDNDWHEAMGKGWALTGDALSFKDPAVGQGMHDALFAAKALTGVLVSHDDWAASWDRMAESYGRIMNGKTRPLFELACAMTRNVPVTPEQTAVNWMIGIHPEAKRAFLGMYNHTNGPEELERVIGGIMSGGAANERE